MKRWAPPKKQWRVDVIPDEDRKMKARHSSQGSDVFDFLRAADPGVVETKERTPSRASSPKSGSLATTPKRGKGLQLHGAPSSPALASSSSSPSTAAVNGSPPLKKVWIDRGYEGYVIAACIMNEVNSINIKHRPYAQVGVTNALSFLGRPLCTFGWREMSTSLWVLFVSFGLCIPCPSGHRMPKCSHS